MIRILHVLGGLNRGGAETMIMNLYRKMDRNIIQFDFIIHTSEHQDYTDEILNMGGKIYCFPKYNLKTAFSIKKKWDSFFTEHPEYKILHSHIRSYASVFLPIAKRHNMQTIIHSHNTSNGKGIAALAKKYLQRSLRKKADYFFGCSTESGKWLFGNKIVASDKFFIINNAIDTNCFTYDKEKIESIKESFGLKDEVVLSHVGRFHPQKNHEFLIDILNDLIKTNDNYRLLLIGDGDLKETIVKKVEDLNIKKYVIFTGIRSDVNQLLMMSDCFVFPSKWEGLPVSVIEAQAAGLQCLLADNITKEVKISDLVTYIPIDKGTQPWIDKIQNTDFHKKDVKSDIISAGFDVNETAKWLTKFYKDIINLS